MIRALSGLRRLAPACLLLLAACATGPSADHLEVERLSAEHDRYQREWSAEQLRFQRENPVPLTEDFGPAGTLYVHEAELIGLPAREKLRIAFTYVNTTGVTLESAELGLYVVDTAAGLEWGEILDLRLPLALQLTHNSSYTASLEVPLRGVWRHAGWTWRAEVTAGRRAVPAGVDGR